MRRIAILAAIALAGCLGSNGFLLPGEHLLVVRAHNGGNGPAHVEVDVVSLDGGATNATQGLAFDLAANETADQSLRLPNGHYRMHANVTDAAGPRAAELEMTFGRPHHEDDRFLVIRLEPSGLAMSGCTGGSC